MSDRIPSAQEILETLAIHLSFKPLRDRFPELTDLQLREILTGVIKSSGARQAAPQQLNLKSFVGARQAAPLQRDSAGAVHKGKWIANIDGASRGNPGPAGSAAWVQTPGGFLELKRAIGHETNNVAEYEALVLVFEAALEHGVQHLEIRSDSELLVKQMTGRYRVKNHNLARRFVRAKSLEKMFKSFTIIHVPREENAEADRLANEAIDEAMCDAP